MGYHETIGGLVITGGTAHYHIICVFGYIYTYIHFIKLFYKITVHIIITDIESPVYNG